MKKVGDYWGQLSKMQKCNMVWAMRDEGIKNPSIATLPFYEMDYVIRVCNRAGYNLTARNLLEIAGKPR